MITGAAGLGAAVSLGAGAASAAGTATASSEVRALSNALRLERAGVIAYRQALVAGVVSAPVGAQLRVLLAEDLKHVARLEQAISRLGAAIPAGPTSIADAQALLAQHQVHRSLTKLSSEHDALRLLINAEGLTEGAYFNAIPRLTNPALVRSATEMLGSDAQHWTVLSGIQHNGNVFQSVPYPFAQGSP
jgi:hypothetical protein